MWKSLRGLGSLLAAGALACGPADPLDHARTLQDRGDHPAALELLRDLVEDGPEDAELQYRYGTALIATGQPSLALWPLQNALESPVWEQKARLALAAAFLDSGSDEKAIETLTALLEDEPEHLAALLLRAHARIQSRRDYEGALADAERVLELHPENLEALSPRTIALLGLGRAEEAARALEDLESLHRDDALGLHGAPGICAARAKFAEEKGDFARAELRYEACLEAFPTDDTLLDEAIAFFDSQSRGERSAELLQKAVDAAPDAAKFRLALANRLRNQGRADEAVALLHKATQRESPTAAADAWANLAHFHMQLGQVEQALVAFDELAKLTGNSDSQLQFAHADALVIAGRYDQALSLADSFEIPAYAEFVRGRVAQLREQPREALERFGEGLRLWPNNAFARYYSAVAAEQLGDFERAVEDYRYAMRIDPAATDAYLRLARLQKASGRPDLALAALRFRAGGRQLESQAARLEMRILAEQGRISEASLSLRQRLSDRSDWGRALASISEAIRDRAGPAAAAEHLLSADALDLEDPIHARALEALIEHLNAAKRGAEALRHVESALEAHPDSAVFHALHGHALWRSGGDARQARDAFERALEVDSAEPLALRGLAELEASGDRGERAVALYERALEADPEWRSATLELARVLALLGRSEEAEEHLTALLREHPYDGEAALRLSRLRLERGLRDTRTRELARRARRFGAGPEAEALVRKLEAGS